MRREVLSEDQVRFYEDNGYLLLENRIPAAALQRLHGEIARLIESARGMTASDERLDLEDSHRPEAHDAFRRYLELSPAADDAALVRTYL